MTLVISIIDLGSFNRQPDWMKACETKEGRAKTLQSHLEGQKTWQASVDERVATLSQQCAAYEKQMANPNLVPIKDKLTKWHAKATGELKGLKTPIVSTETMKKVDEIAAMITGLDQKETVTPEEIAALQGKVEAFKAQEVKATDKKIDEVKENVLLEALKHNLGGERKEVEGVCFHCSKISLENRALETLSERTTNYLDKALDIFKHCIKAMQAPKAPQPSENKQQ